MNDDDDEYDKPVVEESLDSRSEEDDEATESPDAESLLLRAVAVVEGARTMPLSASVLVSREEMLELLQGVVDRLPDELRQARWLLRERDEFIEARRREADTLLEEVRAQAERMVQRTEIVREANKVAQRIVDEAREQSRRLRHEAEDFCDQKLASFEIVLERTLKTVVAGREKLLAAIPAIPDGEDASEAPGRHAEGSVAEDESEFFDQDEG